MTDEAAMKDYCFSNPEDAELGHRFEEDDQEIISCVFCGARRGDQPCNCNAVPVSGPHTVDEHWVNACGGDGSYRGPCGDCYECVNMKMAYAAGTQHWVCDGCMRTVMLHEIDIMADGEHVLCKECVERDR